MRVLFLIAALLGVVAAHAGDVGLSVDGAGYLRFAKDGKLVYAKSAKLTVTHGVLGLADGSRLVPQISVNNTNSVAIDLEGRVSVGGQAVGRIVLALFTTGQDDSGRLFTAAERPTLGNPGEGTNGVIRTGTAPIAKAVPTPNKVVASMAEDLSGKATLVLPDRCEVDSPTITLGSISTVKAPQALAAKLSDIVLGDTPMLPIERIIDRTRILAKIKLAGIDPETVSLMGPDKIRVTRKGQKVTHAQFVESAVQGAKIKGYGGTLEATTPGPDVTAPLGELQLVCESVNGSNVELTATVGIYVDGKRFNSRSVKLRSVLTGPVLKAGTIVAVRVVSGAIAVESKGKVVRFDQSTGQATVAIQDTGAQLTGKVLPNGSVEVKA